MDRPKRSRLRRILKWAGLIACVLIVLTWSLNTAVLRQMRFVVEYVGDGTYLIIQNGAIQWYDGVNLSAVRGLRIGRIPESVGWS